jgi:methyl-accepting chemotaxis protein
MSRSGLRLFGNLKIRARLFLAFLGLSLLIGICGASGLFFIQRIGSSVSVFAEVTSPMLGHALKLVDNVQQMSVVSLNAMKSTGEDAAAAKKLDELEAAGRLSTEALRRLSADAGLQIDMEAIETRKQVFAESLRGMLAAHSRKIEASAKTRSLIEEFAAARRDFDAKLAEMANEAEIKMIESEDGARVEVQTGQATVESLGNIISATLTETFPLLQGVNKLMRDAIKIEEATTIYANAKQAEELDAIQKGVESIFKTAAEATKRIASRLRSDEGKQQVAVITDNLGKLEKLLLADSGVFAAHRDGLAAGAEAAKLEQQAASSEAEYLAALNDARATLAQHNDVAKSAAEQAVSQALLIIGIIIGIGIAAGIIISIVCGNNIVRPVRRLTGAMTQLAAGKFDLVVPDRERNDEIGEMARAVKVFQANAIERAQLEGAMRETRDKEALRQQNLDKNLLIFRDAVSQNLEILISEIDGLRNASESLLSAASQASSESNSSADACSSAAASAQAVAAATEQLDASIRELASRANHTSTIVAVTTEKAETSNREVNKLTEAVHKIDSVITLIRTIAQQTNLLALNATIESARAGEAGRGFAVVAAEVKALSEQTAKATEEIAQQIQTVQATTETAASAIRTIGAQVGEIHGLTTSVAAAVVEQQAATADIARNVHVAADGSNQAAESSRVVKQVADRTGVEAKHLSLASDQLQAVSAAVSKAVQDFIQAVSADITERRTASRPLVDKAVIVTKGGRRFNARAINVSLFGMKLAPVEGLNQGDLVNVDVGFDRMDATVKWINGEECGLEFTKALRHDQLNDPRWKEMGATSQAA